MSDDQKISTFLWFDQNAEEAVTLYTSLFEGSRVVHVARYPEGAPAPAGGVMNITFELAGRRYFALNGGPHYKFTPAISLFVSCVDQEEVDRLWESLLADGGRPDRCGWLQDRFGLSWQIIPKAMMELMGDPDPAKSGRVMQAMMSMSKIDVAALRRAHAGA
ncbi:MAG: 3-demethylubiquinone-9 3-methyltransferase [Myxococcaceae bacterium]|nr:3-demethylubiquinone-9 3-methyltransferase [Myxococcaceae bacterium]